ncbi:MAG: type II secretion system F family protein [Granulosicoccus sp.]
MIFPGMLFIFFGCVLFIFLFVTFIWHLFARHSQRLLMAVERRLRQLHRFEKPESLIAGYLAAAVLLLVCLYFIVGANLLVMMMFVAGLLALPSLAYSYLRARRLQQIVWALPDALSQVSGAMRSGLTFHMALQARVESGSGALEQELTMVLSEQRIGVPMEEALENLADRLDNEDIDLFVSAATIAHDVGGNLAETLQGLSETIRRKSEMEAKIQSLTSQGRLQGNVVTALPLIMLLGLSVVEPDATMPVFTSLLGWIVLFCIFALQITGGLIIRKIVSIDI